MMYIFGFLQKHYVFVAYLGTFIFILGWHFLKILVNRKELNSCAFSAYQGSASQHFRIICLLFLGRIFQSWISSQFWISIRQKCQILMKPFLIFWNYLSVAFWILKKSWELSILWQFSFLRSILDSLSQKITGSGHTIVSSMLQSVSLRKRH